MSVRDMNPRREVCLFIILIGFLYSSSLQGQSCRSEWPVLKDAKGKAIWMNTAQLVQNATHCVPPQIPYHEYQARVQGSVLVDILVDPRGRVACAKLIVGHPLLATRSVEAARKWTFQPQQQAGRPVSFRGRLQFDFVLERTKEQNVCTYAQTSGSVQ